MRIYNILLLGFFTLSCISLTTAQEKNWTLRACIEHALEENITIKQSALQVEEALIDSKDALGNILPSLNASASNFWNSGLVNDPRTGTNVDQTIRTSEYRADLSVTLFDGLRNVRQFQRAKINQLLSQYNLGKSRDDIALFVANSYLQILLNKENLKVIEAQHKITLEQLERTSELVDAGVLPQGDLLEIEATSADELTRIVQAENAVQISLIALAQTLLIKDYENFDIGEQDYLVPASDILNKSITEITTKARESRYEVQIAQQNKLLAEQDVAIAKGAYYPTLSGSVRASTFETGADRFISIDPVTSTPIFASPDNIFDQFSDNRSIIYGFSLSIPVFNGFQVRNGVKRNQINARRAEFQLEQATLDLDSNVYQAYLDAKGSAKAYEATVVAVKAQERAYQYAKDRYDVGLTNAFDFSQSKFRLENALSNEVQAKFDFIFKLKVLELYFGIKVADMKL
ncbi:TolC family protein [Aquimarina sp. ERC-38]|uniref:TolC family protein n=1 Tax=Aquimarina sp. ERC-38 TaxID=2949996 RepID=UPI00224691A4|nr:TolC family protein [Aquimarina sp. ERC-38]UZO81191.1 TolC family protein [Aquimarina sp. ERC-38]